MARLKTLIFPFAVALFGASIVSAASISLDTVGADPPLTSPTFTFPIDQFGNYSATYMNVSNPAFDFITLEISAPFTSGFYFGPIGPKVLGVTCDGGHIFANCNYTFYDSTFTVVFRFFGLDSTHLGVPYQMEVGLDAKEFEPFSTVGATAATAPATVPEPGAFQLAAIGLALCGFFVGGKNLLKRRIRT